MRLLTNTFVQSDVDSWNYYGVFTILCCIDELYILRIPCISIYNLANQYYGYLYCCTGYYELWCTHCMPDLPMSASLLAGALIVSGCSLVHSSLLSYAFCI